MDRGFSPLNGLIAGKSCSSRNRIKESASNLSAGIFIRVLATIPSVEIAEIME